MSARTKRRDIPFGRPWIEKEERDAALEVLSGPILVHGPRSHDFEDAFSRYTSASCAVSLSSCTAGLHLFYFDAGVGPGDEVLVPAQTHVATAHAVEFVGAKPIFVDCELDTGNIDVDLIESLITPRTRAISLVHFLGVPARMDRILEISKEHDLLVLEDCALAIGARFEETHVGLLGDGGCFSFYPVKHMTTAEGGMFITRDADRGDRVRLKRAFGVDRHPGERKMPGIYDVTTLGFNYRMNEIEAAIGLVQLGRMPDFLRARRRNFEFLEERLAPIPGMRVLGGSRPGRESSHYCLSLLLDEDRVPKRTEFVLALRESGIGTSVYYPRPVPHMDYYRRKYGYDESSYPNAARISYGSVALPVGPHLDEADLEYMASRIEAIARDLLQ